MVGPSMAGWTQLNPQVLPLLGSINHFGFQIHSEQKDVRNPNFCLDIKTMSKKINCLKTKQLLSVWLPYQFGFQTLSAYLFNYTTTRKGLDGWSKSSPIIFQEPVWGTLVSTNKVVIGSITIHNGLACFRVILVLLPECSEGDGKHSEYSRDDFLTLKILLLSNFLQKLEPSCKTTAMNKN